MAANRRDAIGSLWAFLALREVCDDIEIDGKTTAAARLAHDSVTELLEQLPRDNGEVIYTLQNMLFYVLAAYDKAQLESGIDDRDDRVKE
jgi:hypothetical protein